NLLGAFK
ncbi:hypothetical protein TNIN_157491, partial [Trichonephila inaurata madagascariensis]